MLAPLTHLILETLDREGVFDVPHYPVGDPQTKATCHLRLGISPADQVPVLLLDGRPTRRPPHPLKTSLIEVVAAIVVPLFGEAVYQAGAFRVIVRAPTVPQSYAGDTLPAWVDGFPHAPSWHHAGEKTVADWAKMAPAFLQLPLAEIV